MFVFLKLLTQWYVKNFTFGSVILGILTGLVFGCIMWLFWLSKHLNRIERRWDREDLEDINKDEGWK